MIYLDYTANTPVHEDVLKRFTALTQEHVANPNAAHGPGQDASALLTASTARSLSLLGLEGFQLIHVSGATEANNLAIKGVAHRYRNKGRHIISTWLEHSSVNGPLGALAEAGYEVSFVDTDPDGRINLNHLTELLRKDTVLVSICAVDSESGVTQDIQAISDILASRPDCRLHLDATQAIGKVNLPLHRADLISFSPHKFYGLVGSGGLCVRDDVLLEIQMHGGLSTSPWRSGTPSLAMAGALEKALELALTELDEKHEKVSRMNTRLRKALAAFPKVAVNSTAWSVPHILNISLPGVNTEQFRAALETQGLILSTRSACCAPNTVSRPIYAITKDRKRALSTLRISLSPLTTEEELDAFLNGFSTCLKSFAG